MLTTDLALRFDPAYEKISQRLLKNPQEFADAFAKAWFKLTHRDMGPISRYLGPEVPKEPQLWQDPVPAVDHELIDAQGHREAQEQDPRIGLSVSQLVSTAWASASSFRGTDKRGGANGARIRLAPQKDWDVNNPPELAKVLKALERVQKEFNDARAGKKKVSLADLIVLGGCAAVEKAAQGRRLQRAGAVHAGTHGCDAGADGREVVRGARAGRGRVPQLHRSGTACARRASADRARIPADAERAGDDRARRRLARAERHRRAVRHGVFTKRPGTLTTDFFVNLIDMSTEWKPTSDAADAFEGCCRTKGDRKWTASRVDLVFGSNSELRALAEVYACDDAQEKFVHDFVAAWDKVMNLDRFDVA